MLETLFSVTIVYEIIQLLHIWWLGVVKSKITTGDVAIASTLAMSIMFGAVIAIHVGGTFETRVGVVYAVMAGCSTLINLNNFRKNVCVAGGLYCVYNLIMTILFILA